jgi:ankyrin repeat protein
MKLKLLIEKGANINIVDENGSIPLHFAAREGRYEIFCK